MNTANFSTQTISFAKDVEVVGMLLKDLQEEQNALIHANIAQIEQFVDNRIALLQALSATANLRYQALAAHGFEANEHGMAAWILQQADDKIAKAWEDFQQQLVKAKELNRINGMLIGKHLQRNKELLQSLQGNQNTAQIYGRNGHAQGMANYRSGMAV